MPFAARQISLLRARLLRPLLGLLVLLVACSAWARDAQPCDERTLAMVAKQLGRSDLHLHVTNRDDSMQDRDTALIAAACKRWPNDPRLIAVTIAYLPLGSSSARGNRTDEWLVALLDPASGTLLQRYDGRIQEDALTQLYDDSLWLDTTRYRLAPGVRSVGVVVHSGAPGPGCPEVSFNEELILLAANGPDWHPVLDTFLYLWHALSPQRSCALGHSERAELTLGIGPGVSHGYADLVVTAKVQTGADGSHGEPSFRTVRKTIQYNGKTYPLEQISTFWQSPPK